MKPLLAAVPFLLVLLAPVAVSDPLDNLDVVGANTVATLEVTPEGALVTWYPVATQVTLLNRHDSYNLYRVVFTDGAGMPVLDAQPELVANVDYDAVLGSYQHLDTAFVPGSLTVYYVRALFEEANVEGNPSNPVSSYPPCSVAAVWLRPPFAEPHPECLFP